MKHKLIIQFPSLLMIPMFSLVGVMMKLFDLSIYSWTAATLTLPMLLYFAWCIGHCIFAILALLIFRLCDKFTR